jgi:hypothetical protein
VQSDLASLQEDFVNNVITMPARDKARFAQLSVEQKFLLFISGNLAWALLGNATPRPPQEFLPELGLIWDAEGLTPEDLRDMDRMSRLLRRRLATAQKSQ